MRTHTNTHKRRIHINRMQLLLFPRQKIKRKLESIHTQSTDERKRSNNNNKRLTVDVAKMYCRKWRRRRRRRRFLQESEIQSVYKMYTFHVLYQFLGQKSCICWEGQISTYTHIYTYTHRNNKREGKVDFVRSPSEIIDAPIIWLRLSNWSAK